MHKYHNYHAILHKLYMWFGENELRLYLNRAKKIRLGTRPPQHPSKHAHVMGVVTSGGSTSPVFM